MKKQINKIAGIALSFALLLTLVPVGYAVDTSVTIQANVLTGISLSNDNDVTLTVAPITGSSTDDTQDPDDGSNSPGNVLTITNNDPVGFNINVKLTAADLTTPDDLSSVVPALAAFKQVGTARIEAVEPGTSGNSQSVTLSYSASGSGICEITSGTTTGIIGVGCDEGVQAVGDITLDEGSAGNNYQVNVGDSFSTKTEFTANYITTAELIATDITDNIAGYTAIATGAVIDITAEDYGIDTVKVDIVMRGAENVIVANTMATTDMNSGVAGGSTSSFIGAIDAENEFNATGGSETQTASNVLPANTYTLSGGEEPTTATLASENGTIQFRSAEGAGLTGGHDDGSGAGDNYINYSQNLVFYVNEDETLSIVSGAKLNIDHLVTATDETASGSYLGTVLMTMTPTA